MADVRCHLLQVGQWSWVQLLCLWIACSAWLFSPAACFQGASWQQRHHGPACNINTLPIHKTTSNTGEPLP
jgi:hypothetical protein